MLSKHLPKDQLLYFTGFSLVSVLSILGAIATETWPLMALPVLVLFAYITILDFKKIFYLLLFCLPLTTELDFKGFSVDFPSELLMVALMFVFALFLLGKPKMIDFRFLKHPISLMLFTHVFWIGVLMFFSVDMVVSLKFFLAKNWYVITFFLLGGTILRSEKPMRTFFWLIYAPLTILVIQVLVRYGMLNFAFEDVNDPMFPFFRNHVNYAAVITIFYPFIWLAGSWYKGGTWKKFFINLGKVLYVVAIYLSYTRACYLALLIAAACFVIVKWNLVREALVVSLVGAVVVVAGLAYNNNYLKLAPEYTQTVYHKEFGDHLTATVELKDVSSMERVYRWIAAFYMTADKPVTGFGPGNFYPHYKKYTVSEFETYTSDNEERSTVHNYFLLIMVEQGVPGIIIFLLLTYVILASAQKAYKQARNQETKNIIMAATLGIVVVYVNLLLSDLLEANKIASLYFLCLGILVNYAVKAKEESETPVLSEETAA